MSSQPPVHVLRVLPRTVDTVGQSVRLTSSMTIPTVVSSQPSWVSAATSALASRFRPPASTATSFQAAFNRAAFSPATGPSLHQLLSRSTASSVHSTRSRLPFSSSSPNLAAAAAANKHVLIDSHTGQVMTTVLPPAGNGRWQDDGKLRKNSSVASGIASVSAVKFVTSADGGDYVIGSVCLFVCLPV